MAEFLVHRDQMQKSSSLVLKVDNPTYGTEDPFIDPCLTCPVKNTRIANGCTTLRYNSYTQDVRAIMLTTVESQCGIIDNPAHTIVKGNDHYDSLMAAYTDKKTFIHTRNRVIEVLKRLAPED